MVLSLNCHRALGRFQDGPESQPSWGPGSFSGIWLNPSPDLALSLVDLSEDHCHNWWPWPAWPSQHHVHLVHIPRPGLLGLGVALPPPAAVVLQLCGLLTGDFWPLEVAHSCRGRKYLGLAHLVPLFARKPHCSHSWVILHPVPLSFIVPHAPHRCLLRCPCLSLTVCCPVYPEPPVFALWPLHRLGQCCPIIHLHYVFPLWCRTVLHVELLQAQGPHLRCVHHAGCAKGAGELCGLCHPHLHLQHLPAPTGASLLVVSSHLLHLLRPSDRGHAAEPGQLGVPAARPGGADPALRPPLHCFGSLVALPSKWGDWDQAKGFWYLYILGLTHCSSRRDYRLAVAILTAVNLLIYVADLVISAH